MSERPSSEVPAGFDDATAQARAAHQDMRVHRLQGRVRYLEARLAAYEPQGAVCLDEWLAGPQRRLSSAEVAEETRRLLAICAEQGVSAVVPEVCTCRELLVSLADACFRSGLTAAAGQYLDYLAAPFAHD